MIQLNPIHVIAWRLLWFLPLQTFRWMFIACAWIGWGRRTATDLYWSTR